MATSKQVLNDAYICITSSAGTFVLSNLANSVELTDEANDVDVSSFGPSAYKEYAMGMKDANVAITFFANYGAGTSTHGVLQPLYTSGTTFTLEVRPTSSGVSSDNPKATMTSRLYAYSGISGGVGDASTMDVTIRNAGTAGLVWATA